MSPLGDAKTTKNVVGMQHQLRTLLETVKTPKKAAYA
jgi:hypothetical protein